MLSSTGVFSGPRPRMPPYCRKHAHTYQRFWYVSPNLHSANCLGPKFMLLLLWDADCHIWPFVIYLWALETRTSQDALWFGPWRLERSSSELMIWYFSCWMDSCGWTYTCVTDSSTKFSPLLPSPPIAPWQWHPCHPPTDPIPSPISIDFPS